MVNNFYANIPNLCNIWTYRYPRKNVKSSKLTEAVRRNFKKIFVNLNFSISVCFRQKFSQRIF
jgi:hypothetical protein